MNDLWLVEEAIEVDKNQYMMLRRHKKFIVKAESENKAELCIRALDWHESERGEPLLEKGTVLIVGRVEFDMDPVHGIAYTQL